MPIITWNPSNKGNQVTLYNNNMTVGQTSYLSYADGVLSTEGKTTGKWYWEIKYDTGYAQSLAISVGVASSSFITSYDAAALESSPYKDNQLSFRASTKTLRTSGSSYGTARTFVVGDIIGFKLDMDGNTLELLHNGTSLGVVSNNIKSLGSTLFAFAYTPDGTSTVNTTRVTANFGATTFVYGVPAGYSQYDPAGVNINLSDMLTKRTNLNDLMVGDYIECEYTASSGAAGTFANLGSATKAEISKTGSATLDGKFNFICVERKSGKGGLLIADRPIQHTIAWDTLNTAGLIEGKVSVSAIPIQVSNTNQISCSSSIVGAWDAYKAFNGVSINGSDGWASSVGTTGWLAYDFVSTKVIGAYQMKSYASNDLITMPKNWTFEGWSGTDWVTLDTQINQNPVSTTKIYYISTPASYAKYRINVSANNGGTSLIVGELLMFEGHIIRSISGGNSYATSAGLSSTTDQGFGAFPVINEWDKYIVNSTLGGKITAGNNAVWCTELGVATMARDTLILGTYSNGANTSFASLRCLRDKFPGYGVDKKCVMFISTNSPVATLGFRPILEFSEDGTIFY
jgi:hypothetical protein